MFGQTVVNWAKTRYHKEHHYMMRLWRASWRISKPLTFGAVALGVIVLSIPSAVVGFGVGKFFGTTVVNPNIYLPSPVSLPQSASSSKASLPDDISSYSDAQLIEYAIRFAAGLRIFESNSTIAEQNIEFQPLSGAIGSKPREAEWMQRSNQEMQLRNQEITEFKNVYLQPAVKLRDEITERLERRGIFITPDKRQSLAFNDGLFGPYPIADMADFLESSARRLQ